ncbi:hypothetical protein EDO6_03958 [Paenibacillus xylanexedens]|nr:hypothetical protein EDO6_03958 [Paenibacillus xylanexedens]
MLFQNLYNRVMNVMSFFRVDGKSLSRVDAGIHMEKNSK